MEEKIHIGTSGWHYDHWRGSFYPEGISPAEFLKYYADHFQTVEINNSFYRLPEEKTLLRWQETVPASFIFAVKASRFITHIKKLKDPKPSLAKFLQRVEILGKHLGPILFQLPPGWRCNLERLRDFLQALPKRQPCTFEFRHPGWFHREIYRILEEYGAAFCIYELAGQLSPRIVTADFVYVRLHGPGGPYQGQYSDWVLAEWARAFLNWKKEGKEIYCYFDNDEAGYAARNAWRLQQMLQEQLGHRVLSDTSGSPLLGE